MKKIISIVCIFFFQFVIYAQDSEEKKLSLEESQAIIEPQIKALFKDHLVDFFIVGAEFHSELDDYEIGDFVIEISFLPYKSSSSQIYAEKITKKIIESYKIVYTSDAPIIHTSIDSVLFIMDKYGNDQLHKVYFTSMHRKTGKRINWERADKLNFHILWKRDYVMTFQNMNHAPK